MSEEKKDPPEQPSSPKPAAAAAGTSPDRRHDFGSSLKIHRCCKCRGVTWNRGDEKTEERYCLPCFNKEFPLPADAAADAATDASLAAAPKKDAEAATPSKKKEPKPAEPKGVRLHVKNLDEAMTTDALLALFGAYGTVKKGEVKTDKEGKSKGFGQVIMSTEEQAQKAIEGLNDTNQGGEKSISVILAPVLEPEKNEKTKGKGKGKAKNAPANAQQMQQMQQMMMQQQMQQMYANTSPQVPPWMMDNSYQMDPHTLQIMQQQMYTYQLYAHMATEQAKLAGEKGAGKSKGKGKGKAKDKGTKVEGTFTGKLKSINFREDKGFGFIDCAETMATYARDVYVSTDLVPKGAKVGDQFEFNVTLDQRGQLRATNVVSK